ncbi:T9SS type B sorting domain-containing protein [Flavobacterium oreochromis]|uniref:T9SS type B sorting domain-containing protein n=1 Tax=Flavobacterium oreochromis TaxID=2906078 RepID=UPI0038599B2B
MRSTYYLCILLFWSLGFHQSFAQNFKDFSAINQTNGFNADILLIGNNNLSVDKTLPYNGSAYNDDVSMQYVDIDTDRNTYNSSTAKLTIPVAYQACYKVKYAALYWAGIYESRALDITKVKLKLPGATNYQDIVGNLIHDGASIVNKPYAAYADITNLLNGGGDVQGDYTVANIPCSTGKVVGGYSAGWHLYIIYENPNLPAKNITSFNGFIQLYNGISADNQITVNVNGFKTIPNGNVNAWVAFGALEGDQQLSGDFFKINNVLMEPPLRKINQFVGDNRQNFFNSTLTDPLGSLPGRNPSSSNTLGYDAGIFKVANPSNSVIKNNDISASISLGTNSDRYYVFFTAFAVDVIGPKIVLRKNVTNNADQDISNQSVNICDEINYNIYFDNIGNDDAQGLASHKYGTNYVLLKDILPQNVNLQDITSDDVRLNAEIKREVNPANPRELFIYIPKKYLIKDAPEYSIKIKVKVACSCPEFTAACSNEIKNQAFVEYSGVINNIENHNDPSYSQIDPNCLVGSTNSTNFIVGLDKSCNFTEEVFYCGTTTKLKAGNNYKNYVWTGPAGAIFLPNNTSQEVEVNLPGTYTVTGTDPLCRTIVQTFKVKLYGSDLQNPLIKYDNSLNPVLCSDSGERIPIIYLCGKNDSKLLQPNITGTIKVEWQLYDETKATCGPYNPVTNCPVTDDLCWTKIVEANEYTVSNEGKYRLIFTFVGGCTKTFYFNVYKNLTETEVSVLPIVCGAPGSITVTKPVNSTGRFQFQLVQPNGTLGVWTTNPVFPILTTGNYSVNVKDTTVPGSCQITIDNIGVPANNIVVSATVTQPKCNGDLGSVNLGVSGVNGPYTYTLYQGTDATGLIVGSSVTTTQAYNIFDKLTPGLSYYWIVTTPSCTKNGTFVLTNPDKLILKPSLTKPLTDCTNGEITISATGGTPPYYFYLNSAPPAPFLATNVISVTTPGINTITVYDANNCTQTEQINVVKVPAPTYTVSYTDVKCYNDNSGTITFNVTNANGNTLAYSITGGAPFSNNPSFANLAPGVYTPVIQYTIGTAICTKTEPNITISQPATPLTASGGVMALACNTTGGTGIIRITNVEGGKPFTGPSPYQYNFGTGWTNVNQASVLPGTYTIYVRDAADCVFPMTVTLDPIPPDPTINLSAPAFNCNGSATSTVTVNSGSSAYTYTYSITPALTPPHDPNSNVFQNVQCGNSTITVNYNLTNPPTFSNLLKEDFGNGDDTTSPGINSNYCFERQINNPAIYCKKSATIEDGDYSVTERIENLYGGLWYSYKDHTSNGTVNNGRFLAVNIGGAAGVGGILYSKPIKDIIPNQNIRVSLWAGNIMSSTSGPSFADPNLTIQLIKDLGLPTQAVIATQNTGSVPKNQQWNKYLIQLNPGNNSNLSFVIRSNLDVLNGNDVVIDDIEAYQMPITCLTTKTIPVNIPCGQAFSAEITGHKDISCAGLNDATITIAAKNFNTVSGYQVSMNNGTTWTSYKTSPITITVPATGYPGFVLVKYDLTPANSACSFNLPQVIVVPAQLQVQTNITSATCTTGAIVSVTANGGTPAYQYQLETPAGVPVLTYQSSNKFNNVAPGNYVVLVKDANGCTEKITINIGIAPKPTIQVLATSDFCYDGIDAATIAVSASGGTPGYQYQLENNTGTVLIPFQNSATFSNLTPGSYIVVVRDTFGCTAATSVQQINSQLTASATLIKDADCNPLNPNAEIILTVSNGYPGYSYQVSTDGGINYIPATPTPIASLPFKYVIPPVSANTNYQFLITDLKGCKVTTNTITVKKLEPIIANPSTVAVTCNGAADGSVTFAPTGGAGGYQINFNNTGFSNQTTYASLAQGTYNYIIRDVKQCTISGSITINQPDVLKATAVLSPNYTCTSNATITVTVLPNESGAGTVEYSNNNGVTWQTSNIFNNLTAGTYTIVVRDKNGCRFTINPPFVIVPLTPPTDLTVTPTSSMTCPSKTINVQVTVTGGSSPIQYAITTPVAFAATNSTGTFTNLPTGTYTFVVTDAKGCSYSENYTVNPLQDMSISNRVLSHVKCLKGTEGSAEVSVSNFGAGYTYVVTGPTASVGTGTTSPFVLNNLSSGNYTVDVTNTTTKCKITTSFEIKTPTVALDATLKDDPITCLKQGSIIVNATGGWGGYTYTISPAVGTLTGNIFSNLPANNYTVTIKDAGGCQVSKQIILNDPTRPMLTLAGGTDFCYDNNAASLVVSASGGVAPYSFSLNGGAFVASNTPTNNHTFNGLIPGTYTVSVQDAYGCTNATLFQQTINNQLSATITLNKGYDCTVTPDAIISGTISNGYLPYGNYEVSYNGGVFTPVGTITGSTFTYPVSLANPGIYQFRITDAKGCITSTNILDIKARSLPKLSLNVTNPTVKCHGDATGAFTWSVTDGTPDYTISVLNTTTGTNYGTKTAGLPAGDYSVTVTDIKSCTDTKTFTITEPQLLDYTTKINPITCNIATNSYNRGSICINTDLIGGTLPIKFTLINASGVQVGTDIMVGSLPLTSTVCFDKIDYGVYTVKAVDQNGCSKVIPNQIVSSPPSGLTFKFTGVSTCATGASLQVDISGGIIGPGTYQFGIVNLPAAPWSNTFVNANNGTASHIFNGLIPGASYTIVVYDTTTGCYHFQKAPVTPSFINPTLSEVINNVTCKGAADGAIKFTLGGLSTGVTQFSYQLINAATNLNIGAPVLINAPFVYPYSINPLAPGLYNILIREINGANAGCGKTFGPYEIKESATDLTLNLTSKNDNCKINAGTITAAASGGTGPYLYQVFVDSGVTGVIDGTDPVITDPAFINSFNSASNVFNLEGGKYIVYVKDAYGCIKFNFSTVLLDPEPVIALNINDLCATEGNFAINVALTTSGIAPHVYSIDGGVFQAETAPFTISNLFSGVHTVEVKDKNNCTNKVTVTILKPLKAIGDFTVLPNCSSATGTITIKANDGSGNYSYTQTVPVGTTNTTGIFTGVPSGNYTFEVTDLTTNCKVVIPVNLAPAKNIVFKQATVTNTKCIGSNDGSITVNLDATNTDAPYQYSIAPDPKGVGVQNTNLFTGLPKGNYVITVTSARGCKDVQNVFVDEPSPINITTAVTQFACNPTNAYNSAQINVTAVTGGAGGILGTAGSGGLSVYPIYEFELGGVVLQSGASPVFSTLNTAGGSYTVRVFDSNNCVGTKIVDINPITPLSATIVKNQAIDCTQNEIITINALGGSGNYNYQVIPFGAVNVVPGPAANQFTISAAGSYTFQVTDATTGCFIQIGHQINVFKNLTATLAPGASVKCFGDTTGGTLLLNVQGYSGPYTYTLYDNTNTVVVGHNAIVVDNTITNPFTISGLQAGTYTVKIKENNFPKCDITTASVSVGTPTKLAITATVDKNDNCNPLAGVIKVLGNNGTPSYSYIVSLATDPAPTAGSIGWTTSTVFNRDGGNYIAYVKDDNNCIAQVPVALPTDTNPVLTLPAFANDQCTSNGTNYLVTATSVVDGVAPYTYSITNSKGTSSFIKIDAPYIFDGLVVGNNTITIKDANGCTDSKSITVYSPLNINPTIVAQPSCNTNDGKITLTAVGGSGNYQYEYGAIVNTTGIFIGLPFGNLNFTVKDLTTNCPKIITVQLEKPEDVLVKSIELTSVICKGDSNGLITVNLEPAPSNGNPIYTYALVFPSQQTRSAQTDNVFKGLPAGNYTVEITSGRNCKTTKLVTISEPAVITVPPPVVNQFACTPNTNSVNAASITINGVTGGSGNYVNYEFILNGKQVYFGSQKTYTTTDATGGKYTINVYDDKGCKGTVTADVLPFVSISGPNIFVNNGITCKNGEDITVTVTTTGTPVPVYNYNVTNILTGVSLTNTTGIFTNLGIGNYMVTVTNPVTNCSVQKIHYIADPNTFNIKLANIKDVTCKGSFTGSVDVSIVDAILSNGDQAGEFNYTVTNNITGFNLVGTSTTAGPVTINKLSAGTYTLNVTLVNKPNCTFSSNFTINEPVNELTIATTEGLLTCTPGNDGSISVVATGGWGNYTYAISPVEGQQLTPGVFTGLSGNSAYTVTVKDANNCSVNKVVNLLKPLIIDAPNIAPIQLRCFGVNDGVVQVLGVTGGYNVPNGYNYTLHYVNPVGTTFGPQTSNTFTNLAPGRYYIIINDASNCPSRQLFFDVLPAKEIKASLSLVANSQICDTSQASLTLTATGGTGIFEYSNSLSGPWTPFVSPLRLNNLVPGTYKYYVRDTNACQGVETNGYTISALSPFTIDPILPIKVSCSYDKARIIAHANGGQGNYTFVLLPVNQVVVANSKNEGIFENVPVGNYTVQVRSGNCTSVSTPVSITSPAELNFTLNAIQTTCSYNRDGKIVVKLTGIDNRKLQYSISSADGVHTHQEVYTVSDADLAAGTFTISNLRPSTYEVNVFTVSTSCHPPVQTIRITAPAELKATVTGIDEVCAKENKGEIHITNIQGGTGPYYVTKEYKIHYDNSNPPVEIDDSYYEPINNLDGVNSHVFDNLDGKKYLIAIKDSDATNCKAPYFITIGSGDSFEPLINVTYPCNPLTNKPMVRIEVINKLGPKGAFVGNYKFSLDNLASQTSNVFLSTDPKYINQFLAPAFHTVFVEGPSGCPNNNVLPTPFMVTPLNELDVTLSISGLNTAMAVATGGSGNYKYTFFADGQQMQSGSSNTFIYYQQYEQIKVIVTDDSECNDSDAKRLTYIPICIPDVMTPDGNGENDDWGPGCVDPIVYPRLVTHVYDRYGRLIATLPVGARWNGKYNGKELPSGDYWYVIKVDNNDGKEFVGHFTLYR